MIQQIVISEFNDDLYTYIACHPSRALFCYFAFLAPFGFWRHLRFHLRPALGTPSGALFCCAINTLLMLFVYYLFLYFTTVPNKQKRLEDYNMQYKVLLILKTYLMCLYVLFQRLEKFVLWAVYCTSSVNINKSLSLD